MNKELKQEVEKYLKSNYGHINGNAPIKEAFIAGTKSKYVEKQIKKLRKEKNTYEKAYKLLICYFDSISDEEQVKVAKKLDRIFNNC